MNDNRKNMYVESINKSIVRSSQTQSDQEKRKCDDECDEQYYEQKIIVKNSHFVVLMFAFTLWYVTITIT